jgi:adenine-specific DNA-methyltransferase
MAKKKPAPVSVDAHKHVADTRPNIPTRETAPFADDEPQTFVVNCDRSHDPQLVWKGKDEQDAKPLDVPAVPIHVQEKVHPRAIVEDVGARAVSGAASTRRYSADLFADFNGLDDFSKKLEFYQHDQHWTNRLVLGDSLLVMASLAERERLRGTVQCVYFDPPYGIKFGSNWQVSTRKQDVKDARAEDLTRQPEQVKAFRDTWELGVHSYLSYMRDRLAAARDLLTESGSIFVQIGDENVHLVRCLLDEVFGSENFIVLITIQKTGAQPSELLAGVADYVLWYAKDREHVKARMLHPPKEAGVGEGSGARYTTIDDDGRHYQLTSLTSAKPPGSFPVEFQGNSYVPEGRFWTTEEEGFKKLIAAGRVAVAGKTIRYKRYLNDFPATRSPRSGPMSRAARTRCT